MIDRIDCRQIDLELLFDDRRDDAKYDSTRIHVETCPACQQRMQSLAASDEWWRDCRAHLGTADDGSARGSRAPDFDHACSDASLSAVLSAPSHPELLGRLGRYDVERILGRGGMGMVFKAFDAELNRPVAVKVLAPHLAGNGPARQRFGREARAAAAVVHEHVIAIHDVQAAGETPYLVMQYVPGDSLQAHVDRHGPLDVRDVVRVGHQIAAGLAAAHAQGVVHRDIKPGNILLENGLGRIVITDFGLAQAADECSLTHTGTLAGTPHYMSPEQADARPLDHRTDLFSLGSVLYFMASGRVPFRGDRAMSVLRSICQEEPKPLRSINPDVPAALETLIARLHAKSPDERFGSAAEVRDLLAEYLAHLQQPLTAPLPQALRGVFPLKRHKWWVVPAAGVSLTATAVVWQALNGNDDPTVGERGQAAVSASAAEPIELPAGLWPLEEVDRQLREARDAIDGLERTWADAGAAPMESAGAVDVELSRIEAAVQGLEATSY